MSTRRDERGQGVLQPGIQVRDAIKAALGSSWQIAEVTNNLLCWNSLEVSIPEEPVVCKLFPQPTFQEIKNKWRTFWYVNVDVRPSSHAGSSSDKGSHVPRYIVASLHNVSGSKHNAEEDHRQMQSPAKWQDFKFECVGIVLNAMFELSGALGRVPVAVGDWNVNKTDEMLAFTKALSVNGLGTNTKWEMQVLSAFWGFMCEGFAFLCPGAAFGNTKCRDGTPSSERCCVAAVRVSANGNWTCPRTWLP